MKCEKIITTLLLSSLMATGSIVPMNNFGLSEGVQSQVYALEGNEIIVGKGGQHSTISSAIKNAKAGDVIVVRAGTYNEQITMTKSGTSSKYITIKAYPGETPIIDGKGLDTIVDFNGQDYINFEGFKIQNITGKQWASGVYLGGGEKYINLRNLEITGIINPKPTSDDYGANPLLLFGEKSESIANVVIENCYVHDNVTGWCEAIAVSGNCENIQVLNNRVDNNGNIGIDFCGNFGYAPSNDQPRNCVARGNVISNCNSPYATSYGLYADGAYDILFEDNIIYNSQGGIEIGAEEKTNNKVGDIIVRNNLVYGCSENGITVGGYETGLGNVDNVTISHNTVVNNNCELTLSKCSNITIENNIFKGKELVYSEMSSSYTKNITFNNNVYDGSGFSLANKSYNASSWKSSIDKNAIMQSVKLNSDYELQDNIVGSDGLLVGYTAKKVEQPPVEEEKPVVPPVEEEDDKEENKPQNPPTQQPDEDDKEEEKPQRPSYPNDDEEDDKEEEKPVIPPADDEDDKEEDKPQNPPVEDEEDKEEDKPVVPPVEDDKEEEKPQRPSYPNYPSYPNKPNNPEGDKEEEKPVVPPTEEDKEEEKPQNPPTQQPDKEEEEKPQNPPADKEEEEKPPFQQESNSVLPSFGRGVWFADKNVSNVKYPNKNSVQFKSKKAWDGIWLEDVSKIKGKITISADSISKNAEIQVYANGREVAVLNSKTKSKTITIPNNAKSVDVAIVSTKKNVTVEVKGLEVKVNEMDVLEKLVSTFLFYWESFIEIII